MEYSISKNHTIELWHDEDVPDPLKDHASIKMVCNSKRLLIGRDHDYDLGSIETFTELEQEIREKENPIDILPLYMYDHGDKMVSILPLNDHFDSGKIGFIVLLEKYSQEELTKILANYNLWLNGETYGFTVYEHVECNLECIHKIQRITGSGYIGSDFKTNGMLQEIDRFIDEEYLECQNN